MSRNYDPDEIAKLATAAVRAGRYSATNVDFTIYVDGRGRISGQNDSGSADGFIGWEIDGAVTDLWGLWGSDPDAPDPFDRLPEDVVKMLDAACDKAQ